MKKSMNNRFSQKIRCFIKTVDRTEVIVAFKISKFNSSLKDSSPGYESRLTHFSLILYYSISSTKRIQSILEVVLKLMLSQMTLTKSESCY